MKRKISNILNEWKEEKKPTNGRYKTGWKTYIVDVKANKDYNEFTVTLDSGELSFMDSFSLLAFYMYGGMYNIFTEKQDTTVNVIFVDRNGKVIETACSDDMGN